MRKPIAILATLALAVAAPAASLAHHAPGPHAKKPCPTVGEGKAKAKGHAKNGKSQSGKGRKCGHLAGSDSSTRGDPVTQ